MSMNEDNDNDNPVFLPRHCVEEVRSLLSGFEEGADLEAQTEDSLRTQLGIIESELDQQPELSLEERKVVALEKIQTSQSVQSSHLSEMKRRLERMENKL